MAGWLHLLGNTCCYLWIYGDNDRGPAAWGMPSAILGVLLSVRRGGGWRPSYYRIRILTYPIIGASGA